MLLGSSLDEVWGKDFLKKKKKSKKISKSDAIDDQILIPDTNRLPQVDLMANHKYQDEFKYPGYDNSFDNNVSFYSSNNNNNIVSENNKYIKQQNIQETITRPTEDSNQDSMQSSENNMITISQSEYNALIQNKSNIIEGFNTNIDEQFHLLLLYIFTGIFFLMSLDTMYQLGKKSY